MKSKNIELDVDFIGGQDVLTAEEEKMLSEYFKNKKKLIKKPIKSFKHSSRKKITI